MLIVLMSLLCKGPQINCAAFGSCDPQLVAKDRGFFGTRDTTAPPGEQIVAEINKYAYPAIEGGARGLSANGSLKLTLNPLSAAAIGIYSNIALGQPRGRHNALHRLASSSKSPVIPESDSVIT